MGIPSEISKRSNNQHANETGTQNFQVTAAKIINRKIYATSTQLCYFCL